MSIANEITKLSNTSAIVTDYSVLVIPNEFPRLLA